MAQTQIPPGLLAFIKQSPQAPINPMSLIPQQRADPTLQQRMREAYEQKQAQEAADKIGGIMGNQAQPEQIGAFDEEIGGYDYQPQQQASGMFEGASPEQSQQLEFAQGLIESGNPMLQDQGINALQKIQNAANPVSSGMPSNVKEWEYFNKLEKKDQQRFLDMKRGGTKVVRINGVPTVVPMNYVEGSGAEPMPLTTLEDEATGQGRIANVKKREEVMGGNLARAADESIKNYEAAIDQAGILDKAMQAIDDGASSTALMKYTPTLRASTARLKAAGNELALNLLTTVTMGALSKSEMDILQQTVMPNMPSADLKVWLQKRKDAQIKLSNLYLEAAQAYGDGESKADFYTRKEAEFKDAKRVKSDNTNLDDLVNKYAD